MNGNFNSVTNFIWNVADLLRDVYKRKDYPDVILPFTVLRRLDCELSESKEKVLETYQMYFGKLEDPSAVLMKASGHNFYNISKFDFGKLLSDPANIKQNFFDYLNGFSSMFSSLDIRISTINLIISLGVKCSPASSLFVSLNFLISSSKIYPIS